MGETNSSNSSTKRKRVGKDPFVEQKRKRVGKIHDGNDGCCAAVLADGVRQTISTAECKSKNKTIRNHKSKAQGWSIKRQEQEIKKAGR